MHTRSVRLADDGRPRRDRVDDTRNGGADLTNLVNEAALLGARRGHARVGLADFTDALEKIALGAERRDNDRYGYGAAFLHGRIIGALGGHAAEELVYGDVTTGAESDPEQVTRIARLMVGRWGMSEAIGKVSVLPRPDEEQSLLLPGTGQASDQTLELVDAEVRRIVDECYEEALEQLRATATGSTELARALLEYETLDEADAYRIAGIERARGEALPKGTVAEAAASATDARPVGKGGPAAVLVEARSFPLPSRHSGASRYGRRRFHVRSRTPRVSTPLM